LNEFISISLSHVATMGQIKRNDWDGAKVVLPMKQEMTSMTKLMSPLINKQIANAKLILKLETLRNTLLPKLMSGEVRVEI
jgi:type I restriction enzyme S subunit